MRARPEPTQLEDLSDVSFLGKLLVLPANVRLDWKVIARYKHSNLFDLFISNEEKKFYNIDTRIGPVDPMMVRGCPAKSPYPTPTTHPAISDSMAAILESGQLIFQVLLKYFFLHFFSPRTNIFVYVCVCVCVCACGCVYGRVCVWVCGRVCGCVGVGVGVKMKFLLFQAFLCSFYVFYSGV